MVLDKIEEAINALREYGSQTKAAEALGVARSTLQDRLKKAEHLQMEREAEVLGFPPSEVKSYWIKSDTGSYYVKRDTELSYNDLREQFLADAAIHAPRYSEIKHVQGDHLLIIDPADVHFGKLSVKEETGEAYNLEIAEKRFRLGVTRLLSKARCFGVDKIVFVLGNDILHRDNPQNTTTSGTRQDVDGMWFQAYQVAKKCYIAAIEEMTQIANVHLVHCPSNHDYATGWMLADSVCSWFANHPNVNVADGSVSVAHRKYVQYGTSLIGFTHGDGAKESDLQSLMQYEARQTWGQTKFGYWYCHHTHHKDRKTYGKTPIKVEKDYTGLTVMRSLTNVDPTQTVFVESVRSPSAPDSWHDRNGYKNMQAIECFLHHHERGQIARFTEVF